jgi:hypothetical protein
MIKNMKVLLLILTIIIAVGCSHDISQYENSEPKFNLFEYFDGESTAWGMIQDYTGKQTRRFEVDIVGRVDGDTLTLIEDFVFDDGEKTQRVWTIVRGKDSEYIGSADDIIGKAYGKEMGNALQWKYDFELVYEGSPIIVAFDDWLYRQDSDHVFNLTKIKKFGIEVGKITLFFQKR